MLRGMDSNHDSLGQSQVSCRWTTPHRENLSYQSKISEARIAFSSRRNLTPILRVDHRDNDRAATDVTVFHILDRLIGWFWFNHEGFTAVRA